MLSSVNSGTELKESFDKANKLITDIFINRYVNYNLMGLLDLIHIMEVKMNKKLLIATIVAFLFFVGCGTVFQNNSAQQNGQLPGVATIIAPSPTPESKKQQYSIITETFSQDNIKIQYPQIKGLGDDSKEKAINYLIKNDLLKNEVEEPFKTYGEGTLTMNLNYQVTLNTPELLSVVYIGNSEVEDAAFPTNEIYTTTIDLKKLNVTDYKINIKEYIPYNEKNNPFNVKYAHISGVGKVKPVLEFGLQKYFEIY
jgi:hypothetical protein